MPASTSSSNFVRFVGDMAGRHPDRLALALPNFSHLKGPETAEQVTFAALWERIEGFAEALRRRHIGRGDRVLVLVPLSADLYAATLAVMAIGAVAVLPPAGGGLAPFRRAVAVARPRAVIGTGSTLRLRWLAPALWRARTVRAGSRALRARPFDPVEVDPDSEALLTFTSGSTGLPKGAARTHATLSAQHLALAASHPLPDDAVAMTCFPVVALHHLCSGIPTVLPAVDLKHIDTVRPEWILKQITEEGVTALTGPPPFVRSLVDAVAAGAPRAVGLSRIGIGGAPVGRDLLESVASAFPAAEVTIVYGSTEAEPVASIGASDLLELPPDESPGYPAGFDDAAASVRLIRIEDNPIAPGTRVSDLDVADGEWGEVVVSGNHVVTHYVNAREEEARHKIRDDAGCVWHRMGDVARRDGQGRLWLGGRVGRLPAGLRGPVPPFPLEIAIGRLPGVARAVLHSWEGHVVLWVEGTPDTAATDEARSILEKAGLPHVEIRTGVRIPVDARHRWKVEYAELDRMMRDGVGALV
jgi:olefin beta-lactone synthetase